MERAGNLTAKEGRDSGLWNLDYLFTCFAEEKICLSFGLWLLSCLFWFTSFSLHFYLRCRRKSSYEESVFWSIYGFFGSMCNTIGALLSKQLTIQIITGAYMALSDVINFVLTLFPACNSSQRVRLRQRNSRRKHKPVLSALSVFMLISLGYCYSMVENDLPSLELPHSPRRRLLGTMLQENTDVMGFTLGIIAVLVSWTVRVPIITRVYTVVRNGVGSFLSLAYVWEMLIILDGVAVIEAIGLWIPCGFAVADFCLEIPYKCTYCGKVYGKILEGVYISPRMLSWVRGLVFSVIRVWAVLFSALASMMYAAAVMSHDRRPEYFVKAIPWFLISMGTAALDVALMFLSCMMKPKLVQQMGLVLNATLDEESCELLAPEEQKAEESNVFHNTIADAEDSSWTPLNMVPNRCLNTKASLRRYVRLSIEQVQENDMGAERLPGDGQTNPGRINHKEPLSYFDLPVYPPPCITHSHSSSSDMSSNATDLEGPFTQQCPFCGLQTTDPQSTDTGHVHPTSHCRPIDFNGSAICKMRQRIGHVLSFAAGPHGPRSTQEWDFEDLDQNWNKDSDFPSIQPNDSSVLKAINNSSEQPFPSTIWPSFKSLESPTSYKNTKSADLTKIEQR